MRLSRDILFVIPVLFLIIPMRSFMSGLALELPCTPANLRKTYNELGLLLADNRIARTAS